MRQELKRYQRRGLGYSKDLETHKLAVALHFGVYNFVRKHKTLGTTPAVAAASGPLLLIRDCANTRLRKEIELEIAHILFIDTVG